MFKQAIVALLFSLSLVAGTSSSLDDYLDNDKKSCANGTAVVNKVIGDLLQHVADKENQWTIFGDLEVLNGVSYDYLYTCNATEVPLENTEADKQSKSEREACESLIEIVSSLLEQNGGGSFSAGDYTGNLETSQEVVELGDKIGKHCNITVASPEDEESEGGEAEEEASAADQGPDVTVQIVDEKTGDVDEYNVYTEPNGPPKVEIIHNPGEKNSTHEEKGGVLEGKFYAVNTSGDTDSGSQWKSGDYERYYGGSTKKDGGNWSKGGYKRYYDGGQGLLDEEDLETEVGTMALLFM